MQKDTILLTVRLVTREETGRAHSPLISLAQILVVSGKQPASAKNHQINFPATLYGPV